MLGRLIRRKIKQAIIKVYDPLVSIKIGTETIKINLSHLLPEILYRYPDYNFNLSRIVKYTEDALGPISVIDIGANVGDTVAFIRNNSKAPILCIDGEENYLKLLRANVQQYKDISICHSLVGTENKEEKFKLKSEKGTAHIEESDTVVRVRTLENILEEFPSFRKSKILKTDTDGFDTWILRSCRKYLEEVKPILFFEFDPHFITGNNDDPFDFINYLREAGYQYLIFYTNLGDLLFGCSIDQREIIDQLIHYFSGRRIETFVDICALTGQDEQLFHSIVAKEIDHFRQIRNY